MTRIQKHLPVQSPYSLYDTYLHDILQESYSEEFATWNPTLTDE